MVEYSPGALHIFARGVHLEFERNINYDEAIAATLAHLKIIRHHNMHDDQCLRIAENTFQKIAERFPSIRIEKDQSAPVELSVNIPVQSGLKYAVHLNLQNSDELHFVVGNFWLEWFPCTDMAKVEAYIDAVSGFLEGRYRVLEHYRGNKCVKAELQAPQSKGEWKTIGTTYSLLWPLLPWRKHFKQLIND